MQCSRCGEGELRVKLPVETEENEIYRKRVCDNCGAVVYTVEYEVVETPRFKREWAHYCSEIRRVYNQAARDRKRALKK